MGAKKHAANLVFTICLIGVFALSAILVAVLGARVYQNTAERLKSNFSTRTSLVYIAEKIRQSGAGGYYVVKFDGNNALVLKETAQDGVRYDTYIFAKNGKLRELTAQEGTNVNGMDGEAIMDVKALDFKKTSSIIRVTVKTADGQAESLDLARRTTA
jgi:hypothetical protein